MIFALSRSARSRINASSPAGGSSWADCVIIFKQISEPASNAKRMVSLTRCRPPTIGPDAKARCRCRVRLTARAALATESYRFTCQRHKVAEKINPSRLGPGLPANASISACTKDRNFNASCQRRVCRRYLIGRAGLTKATIRIGSPQRGQESGKTCILGAPSRPFPGPGFHKIRASSIAQR